MCVLLHYSIGCFVLQGALERSWKATTCFFTPPDPPERTPADRARTQGLPKACFGKVLGVRGLLSRSPRRVSRTSPTFLRLTEATGDVALGAFVVGIGEDVVGVAELDQLAEEEETGFMGDTGCLLHIVGDDDDGGGVAQLGA